MFKLFGITTKMFICKSCRLDFSIISVSERWKRKHNWDKTLYKIQYDNEICKECLMLGFKTRDDYLDQKRSYAK